MRTDVGPEDKGESLLSLQEWGGGLERGQVWGWDGPAITGGGLGIALSGQYSECLHCENWNQPAPTGIHHELDQKGVGKVPLGHLAACPSAEPRSQPDSKS